LRFTSGPDCACIGGLKATKTTEITLLGDLDLHLLAEGTHAELYKRMGAHPITTPDGRSGTYFAVWAPDAHTVSVIGDFNHWSPFKHWLHRRGHSGVWEGFIEGLGSGTVYKYFIESEHAAYRVQKSDPFAARTEMPPRSASVVWQSSHKWGDDAWLAKREQANTFRQPISVYEVHVGSWRRNAAEGHRALTYREMALELAAYVKEMGFTHVELMPITEHPYFGSWGYQTTGYFAPSGRYGDPDDFRFLVDHLHQNGIGVILDWVPSHFPADEHGLAFFDGSHLFEHADMRKGFHPDWSSFIFNYDRNEVRAFLLSSACLWIKEYHIDAIRVDAVASMLYLDYSRKEGEWIPNQYGGRENIGAINFLRQLNHHIGTNFPGVQTMAEESTAWPMVSKPPDVGGLGFHYKWDMGWMHDTLAYLAREPIHRRYHHGEITFRMVYASNENFILPLSHDEVVHGKGSLLNKMPGDDWQKFANLRLLFAYMFGMPGKKLLFMGGEIGQWREWAFEESIDWHLLEYAPHKGIQRLVRDLNHLYRNRPAMHELDCDPKGFQWIDSHDADNSVLSFMRVGKSAGEELLFVYNFTPVPRHGYRIGCPAQGPWEEILNSDAQVYGGSGVGNSGLHPAAPAGWHGRPFSLEVSLPPLGALVFRRSSEEKKR
jgi:1,4-alpha-glucan branching enzyme